MEGSSSSNFPDTEAKKAGLNELFSLISNTILKFQSATTGLFPVGTNDCGQVGDVRSSIYCALSVWSLHLAYKRLHSEDHGRTHLLGQTAVKTMRGILNSWMYQIPKMKEFLELQTPQNSLHVRFDIVTGQVLPGDDDYPHLQLDCISLFLLSLVQMISSGLEVIYTSDEVDFIQSLIYYVERAYRIADYGTWGRGSKYNNGTPELNASTVGMTKAALEAVNGFNLFGEHGAAWTVVYVDIDAHMRNRMVFEGLLPRESSSKATDAALLPVLSWPCFAVHNAQLKNSTIQAITKHLKGRYGIKRFRRDGYGTVLENKNRRYYRASDIKMFDGVENEWPFLTFFLIIDCVINGDSVKAAEYLSEVEPYLKNTSHGVVVPQYYYVPSQFIKAERDNPGGLHKMATKEGEDNSYFLWGQSVYIVMRMLVDNLLLVNELDPIKRHLTASERPRLSHRYAAFEATAKSRLIQVVIIAESIQLQQALATYGVATQTPSQVEPVQIWSPNQLRDALQYMGINHKLGLTGRPRRPVGLLGTSMFYRVCGQTIISYSLLFEVNDFYISQDLNCIVNRIQIDLEMLSAMWKLSGRPTYIIMVTEAIVQSPGAKHLIDLLSSLKSGTTKSGVRVKLDRLQGMMSRGTKEHLDFLTHHDEERADRGDLNFEWIKDSVNSMRSEIKVNMSTKTLSKAAASIKDLDSFPDWKLVELYRSTDESHTQSQALKELSSRHGVTHMVDEVPISHILDRIRRSASHSSSPNWSVVRLCSALTRKLSDSLAPSIATMLVKGKLVTLGVFGNTEGLISKPLSPTDISNMLYDLCQPVEPRETVLQQELILLLGQLHASQAELFDGIVKIRIGWIIHAMQYALNRQTPGICIFSLSPSEISTLLHTILQYTKETNGPGSAAMWRRRLLGSLGCVPRNFYEKIWYILERTSGGVELYGYYLPQQPTLSDLTIHEMKFALLVEEMLSVIRDPIHRHVVVEVFTVVAVILERNIEVNFCKAINIKEILGQVINMFKHNTERSSATDDQVWSAFYDTPTDGANGTYSFMAKAVCSVLLDNNLETHPNLNDCCTM